MRGLHPKRLARTPGKWSGQEAFQGHYWVAGTQTMVWHESMAEYSGVMLLDHLYDIVDIVAQPMLMVFGDGDTHYPDYLLTTRGGGRLLLDVHAAHRTSVEQWVKFDHSQRVCRNVGWDYLLVGLLPQVFRWNLELMAAYRHPRYEPDENVAATILRPLRKPRSFGQLRRAIRTEKPGELMPALYHLMWNRHIAFDLHKPFNDDTTLTAA